MLIDFSKVICLKGFFVIVCCVQEQKKWGKEWKIKDIKVVGVLRCLKVKSIFQSEKELKRVCIEGSLRQLVILKVVIMRLEFQIVKDLILVGF